MSEQVLAFPATALQPFLALFKMDKGIVTDPTTVAAILKEVLNPDYLRFIDRASAEQDPSWKQVIPYTVLENADCEIFAYQRTKKGGESRLHDKWSIGVGGHINPEDGETNDAGMYDRAFLRELQEEVGINGNFGHEIVALLYDPSNSVGEVHFGVVHSLYLTDDVTLSFNDPALSNGVWGKVTSLETDSLENWSKLVVESGVLA